MKRFAAYVEEGAVRRQHPNQNVASSVKRESLERIKHAASILGKARAKYVLENAYEAIREAIDARLLIEGYKSFSHEATVARMLDLGFSLTETVIVDNLRKQRHGIKYYGEEATQEEAEAALAIAQKVVRKLAEK